MFVLSPCSIPDQSGGGISFGVFRPPPPIQLAGGDGRLGQGVPGQRDQEASGQNGGWLAQVREYAPIATPITTFMSASSVRSAAIGSYDGFIAEANNPRGFYRPCCSAKNFPAERAYTLKQFAALSTAEQAQWTNGRTLLGRTRNPVTSIGPPLLVDVTREEYFRSNLYKAAPARVGLLGKLFGLIGGILLIGQITAEFKKSGKVEELINQHLSNINDLSIAQTKKTELENIIKGDHSGKNVGERMKALRAALRDLDIPGDIKQRLIADSRIVMKAKEGATLNLFGWDTGLNTGISTLVTALAGAAVGACLLLSPVGWAVGAFGGFALLNAAVCGASLGVLGYQIFTGSSDMFGEESLLASISEPRVPSLTRPNPSGTLASG